DIEPNNPIIGTRSFGSDPEQVGEYAGAWIDACQAEGVLACAKHFPGHGRTTTDSHKELPRVEESADVIKQTDLVPFRRAIERGVASIMSAHVAFRGLDPERVHQSIERRKRWARWAALSRETNRPARDESGWSTQLAEQVVHMVRGKLPALEQPWNLVIVDDDVGGPYPAPSRDPLVSTLRAGGVDLAANGDSDAERGATVIALFGDIRAWKG